MLKRKSPAQREREAMLAELAATQTALRGNERAFEQAADQAYVEQLIYQHAALMCRYRAIYRTLRQGGADP